MYALFDDAGKFLAGRVMSESDASLQVELDSGKRVKVKAAHVLLRFEHPMPAELFSRARALADDIDLDLAWTFAPAVTPLCAIGVAIAIPPAQWCAGKPGMLPG